MGQWRIKFGVGCAGWSWVPCSCWCPIHLVWCNHSGMICAAHHISLLASTSIIRKTKVLHLGAGKERGTKRLWRTCTGVARFKCSWWGGVEPDTEGHCRQVSLLWEALPSAQRSCYSPAVKEDPATDHNRYMHAVSLDIQKHWTGSPITQSNQSGEANLIHVSRAVS